MSEKFDIGPLADALTRYIQGRATLKDHLMVQSWLHENPQNNVLYHQLKEGKDRQEIFDSIQKYQTEAALNRVHRRIEQAEGQARRRWRGVVVSSAAAVLVVMGIAGIFNFQSQNKPTGEKMMTSDLEIGPAKKQAILILPGGHSLPLVPFTDSAFTSGGANIKSSEEIMNYLKMEKDLERVIQQVVTPSGSTFKMALSDGTQVWMNAGSSIRFPAKFAKQQRRVEVSGEVYFDVAADPSCPFVVTVGATQVLVFGTAFNVRAYTPSAEVTTTLERGEVQVNSTKMDMPIQLTAGEQAINIRGQRPQKIKLDSETLKQVTGWKLDMFIFKGTKVKNVLEEVARWYNVELVYRPGFSGEELYHGEISREVSLNKLCEMLETTGAAHLQLQGRRLIAGPIPITGN